MSTFAPEQLIYQANGFYHLIDSGVNPAAIAYYEFVPGSVNVDHRLKLVLINGDLMTLEGDEALGFFHTLRSSSS